MGVIFCICNRLRPKDLFLYRNTTFDYTFLPEEVYQNNANYVSGISAFFNFWRGFSARNAGFEIYADFFGEFRVRFLHKIRNLNFLQTFSASFVCVFCTKREIRNNCRILGKYSRESSARNAKSEIIAEFSANLRANFLHETRNLKYLQNSQPIFVRIFCTKREIRNSCRIHPLTCATALHFLRGSRKQY